MGIIALSMCIYIIMNILQQGSNLSDTDRGNLQALLHTVINKCKYDEDHNFLSQVQLYYIHLHLCSQVIRVSRIIGHFFVRK